MDTRTIILAPGEMIIIKSRDYDVAISVVLDTIGQSMTIQRGPNTRATVDLDQGDLNVRTSRVYRGG